MSKETYYFSRVLSATNTQATYAMPRSRSFSILNTGDWPVTVEFENDITAQSVTIPVGASMDLKADMLDIRYKVPAAYSGKTGEISIFGMKHEKSINS